MPRHTAPQRLASPDKEDCSKGMSCPTPLSQAKIPRAGGDYFKTPQVTLFVCFPTILLVIDEQILTLTPLLPMSLTVLLLREDYCLYFYYYYIL